MPPRLRLRGQEVEWQTRVRNLGVHIDRSYAYGRSGETCHPSEQNRAQHAAPSSPIIPTTSSQSCPRTPQNASSQNLDTLRELDPTNWTPESGPLPPGFVGVVFPTRKCPGMRQQISPPSRTCDQGKVVDDPRTNERTCKPAAELLVTSCQRSSRASLKRRGGPI
ncbi:hypothetical protein EVAR_97508_1 [Eumeta japonica]|uniref:Uncharacterized protein n=1 Tax=Eumeta variegata TaxID=151549 RepID=A0A4C1WKS5_EUMVA|nr:hypothetical protein EVAR_97508_1 [Eumeta japonica]